MNGRGEKHGDGEEEERGERKRMGGEPDPGRMRQTRDDARDTYPRLDRNLKWKTNDNREDTSRRPRRIVVYVSMIRRWWRVPRRWRSSQGLVAPRFPSRRGGGLNAGDSRGLDAATATAVCVCLTWRARIRWRRRWRVRRRGRRRRRGRGGTRRRRPRRGSSRTWPPDARCTSWPPRLSTRARASPRGTPRDDAETMWWCRAGRRNEVPARPGESQTRERDPRSTSRWAIARAPSEARARTPSTRSP